MRIEKIIATVRREAHEVQAEEVRNTLSEGAEAFYGPVLSAATSSPNTAERDGRNR